MRAHGVRVNPLLGTLLLTRKSHRRTHVGSRCIVVTVRGTDAE